MLPLHLKAIRDAMACVAGELERRNRPLRAGGIVLAAVDFNHRPTSVGEAYWPRSKLKRSREKFPRGLRARLVLFGAVAQAGKVPASAAAGCTPQIWVWRLAGFTGPVGTPTTTPSMSAPEK